VGFYEKFNHPPPLSEIPAWRKFLFFSLLGVCLAITAKGVDEDLTIYSTAPDHPVPGTGQVYRVSVEHGTIRYVNASEKQSWDVWGGVAGSWVGAAFLCAFFVLITSRRKSGI
jgi:hypothetical protein